MSFRWRLWHFLQYVWQVPSKQPRPARRLHKSAFHELIPSRFLPSGIELAALRDSRNLLEPDGHFEWLFPALYIESHSAGLRVVVIIKLVFPRLQPCIIALRYVYGEPYEKIVRLALEFDIINFSRLQRIQFQRPCFPHAKEHFRISGARDHEFAEHFFRNRDFTILPAQRSECLLQLLVCRYQFL